jgi:putative phosphoribosyl transferase
MNGVPTRFPDRSAAGRLLAARLFDMTLPKPVVYALPRGGVPVGLEVARALNAPLDLVLVRKIGTPGAPEVALGAIADGDDPQVVINEDIRRACGATDMQIARARDDALAEIERRRALYQQGRPPIDPVGRTAIVVDDGLATGATAKAALAALRRRRVGRTILAIPVAPEAELANLAGHADDIVCLIAAPRFRGVGAFYDDFHQLTDAETIGLLRQAPGGPACKANS